jgi:hypothetical protein
LLKQVGYEWDYIPDVDAPPTEVEPDGMAQRVEDLGIDI